MLYTLAKYMSLIYGRVNTVRNCIYSYDVQLIDLAHQSIIYDFELFVIVHRIGISEIINVDRNSSTVLKIECILMITIPKYMSVCL